MSQNLTSNPVKLYKSLKVLHQCQNMVLMGQNLIKHIKDHDLVTLHIYFYKAPP